MTPARIFLALALGLAPLPAAAQSIEALLTDRHVCSTKRDWVDINKFVDEQDNEAALEMFLDGSCWRLTKGTIYTTEVDEITISCIRPRGQRNCVWTDGPYVLHTAHD